MKKFRVCTCGVGVHNNEDALEVQLSLAILSNSVAQGYQAGLEFLGVQAAWTDNYNINISTLSQYVIPCEG